MDDRVIIGWGYKFLRILLIILIVTGAIFLVKIALDRLPPDLEKHRTQLNLLEEVYEIRQANLKREASEKVTAAPNEVIAIKYQQDLNIQLSVAEQLYFSDRQAILESDYQVLEDHWREELDTLKRGDGGDDATAMEN